MKNPSAAPSGQPPASPNPQWRFGGITALILGIGFVIYSLEPGLRAWWSIIDDHRKMHILAVEQGMPISAIFRHFWHAIDFPPLGQAMRVQPLWHVLFGAELRIFGLEPQLWYAMRMACAIVFTASLGLLFLRLGGGLAALFVTIAVFANSYIAQIFLRLGVAESYLAPALAAGVMLAAIDFPGSRWKRIILSLCYAAAWMIVFGTKEIGLIFLPLLVFRTWQDFRSKINIRAYAGVIATLFGLFIIVFLGLGLKGQANDIYGQKLSLLDRLAKITAAPEIKGMFTLAVLVPLATWIILELAARLNGKISIFAREMRRWAVATCALATLFILSLTYYNFSVPPGSHYEFPVRMLLQLLVLTAAGAPFATLLLAWRPDRARRIGITLGAAVVLIWTVRSPSDFSKVRLAALDTQAKTSEFRKKVELVASVARQQPDRKLEFVSYGFNDFEPVNSMVRFLRGYGVSNQIILNVGQLKDKQPQSDWESFLRQLMLGIKPSADVFADVVTVPAPSDSTIKVSFSQPSLQDGSLANFWPP